ncbi:MAG: glycosyltransferase family 2 protein [Actinobacteria bacterium]|nr:glycosyltransferase family 2 protein [Actinomycetota bacterium]
MKRKKIFIVMPAYNAERTISVVMARIPAQIWKKINQLIIVNDGSKDSTIKLTKQLKKKYSKIYLIDKSQNEGYAKAQKTAFKYALKKGAEIIVLLHSDGQYAPEEMPDLLKPLEDDKADIVQGSRILAGGALSGSMPLYKYIANRILSAIGNVIYGMNLAEYHSGYMLYSKKALQKVPFEKLSNTFHFDGEMLFMGHKKGLRIKEIPIPTRYAGEKSSLKPIQYGFDVLKIMWDYKTGKYDF